MLSAAISTIIGGIVATFWTYHLYEALMGPIDVKVTYIEDARKFAEEIEAGIVLVEDNVYFSDDDLVAIIKNSEINVYPDLQTYLRVKDNPLSKSVLLKKQLALV